ncbi:hypothetical protein OIU77_020364 [Salix suchowensis]|uniref:Uncharacterized protein n=1 Tax=Salix suchowensis TaxID=1278906 RepID=A0ABQ9CLW5_9ROSI|nr:hypothetical protein OIU77_020364 [Salix suchowensis]
MAASSDDKCAEDTPHPNIWSAAKNLTGGESHSCLLYRKAVTVGNTQLSVGGAGTLAYYLWVKPSQDLKRQQEERAALASSDPYRYIEKRKPIPDPQETGLIYGKKNRTNKSEE